MQENSGSIAVIEVEETPALRYFSGEPGFQDEGWTVLQLQEAAKRMADVVLTVLSLPLSLPLMGLLALAVKLDSPGPVLFRQDQLGRHGCRIRPLKIRSMHVGAEEMLQRILSEGGPLAQEYARYHKLKADPRVTRVGRWLRKTSLDELPQLWNVLKGDMSLVGPRPYLPRELPKMAGHEDTILLVRPGITGLWQVSGRSDTSFNTRVKTDLAYVQHWSLATDLGLLVRTLWVVLRGSGAC